MRWNGIGGITKENKGSRRVIRRRNQQMDTEERQREKERTVKRDQHYPSPRFEEVQRPSGPIGHDIASIIDSLLANKLNRTIRSRSPPHTYLLGEGLQPRHDGVRLEGRQGPDDLGRGTKEKKKTRIIQCDEGVVSLGQVARTTLSSCVCVCVPVCVRHR